MSDALALKSIFAYRKLAIDVGGGLTGQGDLRGPVVDFTSSQGYSIQQVTPIAAFDTSPKKARQQSEEIQAAGYSGPLASLFDGIEAGVFGDTPSLVLQTGAAGFELDQIDHALGSPPNTVCLASSMENGPHYQLVYEEAMAYMIPSQLGSANPQLRSDIAYLEYPGGGEVFSVGSISFCGSLSYNKYENAVSRLTENVLTRFNRPSMLRRRV